MWDNFKLNSKPLRGDFLGSGIVASIEASFQKSSSYSLFSGSTMSGQECGYYGYKHEDARTASAIAFSRNHAYVVIRDAENKTWEQYLIK